MTDTMPRETRSTERLARFLEKYVPTDGYFDESMDPQRELREPWHQLLEHLAELGIDEVVRRHDEGRRLMRESGVVNLVDDGSLAPGQLWELDALPQMISAQEWVALEKALIQRATLLNEILRDVHGQQKLLRNGLLPAELVFANQGFQRACHGMPVPGNTFLHLYAVDVVRLPDGSWCVISDGTQAPSGMGIALENRMTLLRMFPEIYHDCSARRLLPFFNAIRESMHSLAARHRDNPRIVVLTPGAADQKYFEHVYLARYLGYSLVEGSDLTVRDNSVFVKTLGGLLPVDVVLRRLNDSLCDPLELRYESQLGVPGLMQAIHGGNVAVANAIGSGLLNTPAIMPYLPQLCRSMLKQDLLIPSVPTWWCGNGESFAEVSANLHRYVIKTAFPGVRSERFVGPLMQAEQRTALASRMRARPNDYVAQELADCSTSPSLVGGRIVPRHVATRFYLVAHGGSYMVMPGGLSRIADSVDQLLAPNRAGGGTKDTWVLSDTPSTEPGLLQFVTASMPVQRSGMDMPSRVADNLFWLGRYAERAEGTVRLLRPLLARLTTDARPQDIPEMRPLLSILVALELVDKKVAFPKGGLKELDLDTELGEVIFSNTRGGNLRDTVDNLRRTAWMVRDRLSLDAWRLLGRIDQLFHRPPDADAQFVLSEALVMLNEVLVPLAAFSGLAMESMTRGPAWRFLDMGRRLERAGYTNTLLRTVLHHAEPNEAPILQALLEIADSSMTYRSRYLSSLQLAAVIDLLLLDETNPRSTVFQLVALMEHLESLPRLNAQRDPEQRQILRALTTVRVVQLSDLCQTEEDGSRPKLQALLDDLESAVPELSNTISRRYFSHSESVRQLSGGWTWNPS